MVSLCKKYNVRYTFYKNQPLGEKKNHGLNECMKIPSWDYLIELGSDDLIKNELLESYQQQDVGLMCINNLCFINSETLECRNMVSSSSYGLGRAIRRDVIDRHCHGVYIVANDYLMSPGRTTKKGERGFFPVESSKQMQKAGQADIVSEPCYRLWNDACTRGLDNNSNFFLYVNGVIEKQLKFDSPVGIDIKSKVNIWPFTNCGLPYDLDKALEGLSEQEKTAIKWLSSKAA